MSELDAADAWKIKDRRQQERYRTEVEVSVISAFGNDTAVVCDVSIEGAGLVGAHGLARKQLIVIEHGGRLIPARVRWNSGGRCGVQFLSPLVKNDPLLTQRPPVSSGRLAPDLLQVRTDTEKAARTMTTSAIPRFLDQAMQWWSARREARRLAREAIMVERACRKQGYAWLVTDAPPMAAASQGPGRPGESSRREP